MKKWLRTWGIVALLVASLYVCGALYDSSVHAEKGHKYIGKLKAVTSVITQSLSAAEDNYELLPAVTGKRYFIDAVIFAATTQTRMYMNDSNTVEDMGYGPYWTPSTGGTVIDRDILLELDSAAGLYLTTTASADVTIEYHLK